MTPGSQNAPYRTVPGGTTRILLRRDRAWSGSCRDTQLADLDRLQPGEAEVQHDRLLDPSVDHPLSAELLGHTQLTLVERLDRPENGVLCISEVTEIGVCGLDELLVCRRVRCHQERHRSITSTAASHSSTVGTRARRMYPSHRRRGAARRHHDSFFEQLVGDGRVVTDPNPQVQTSLGATVSYPRLSNALRSTARFAEKTARPLRRVLVV